MKKFFSFVMALVAAVALNAATQVTFDFSDASAYGYANPEAGKFTQVPTGAVLTKDGVTITVAFESGNGFRFFAHTTTGAVNLRGYVGASYTIAAPAGKKLAAISADGSNLTSQYLSDGMTSSNWSSETGVESLATNVIKSTVQFNSLVVTLIEEGEVPPTQENIQATVAEAIAAGMLLDSAKTSTDIYDVTGYVVNAQAFSAQHGNQIWFMADDAANANSQEFEAYACTVSENNTVMQVLNGDKVKLTGKLTKYYDKNNQKFIIEIKNGTALFIEKAEGDHSLAPEQIDTISVARAVEIGNALEAGKSTAETYVVKGFACTTYAPNEGYTDQTWYMHDTDPTAFSEFQAYQCQPDYTVQQGDYMLVKGPIMKYVKNDKVTIEISRGTAVHGVGPTIDTIPVTVAQAEAIAAELADNAEAEGIYKVGGYVASVTADFADGTESFYMSDDATATFGNFFARKASLDAAVSVGQYVVIVGKIKKNVYNGKTTYQMDYGKVIEVQGQGIENVVLTEKAQKVVVDGAIYIIRDNKLFNLQGAQVR